ncbi:MAG: hypothetical protein ACOYS2_01465 [Patescibacteria group bacterium]
MVLVVFLLFLPGWSLLLAVLGKSRALSTLERFVFSFGLGLIAVDFIFFAFDFLNLKITAFSSALAVGVFILGCWGIYRYRVSRNKKILIPHAGQDDNSSGLFQFSKAELGFLLILVLGMFFVKTVYLSGTVAPTATDMGHHMYWAKEMAETGKLPTYDGMPDFIIGEHIIFGLMAILGKLSFFGAFPLTLLYLFNLLGILTVFLLTLRIFGNRKVAILTLFILGTLFAVSSPQAKFVSGGVIGNIMGNYLMPMALYFYFRAFGNVAKKEFVPRKEFILPAVFASAGLFYTHHLSGFIFLFSFVGILSIFILRNIKGLGVIFRNISKMLFSRVFIASLFFVLIFFFFIFTPNFASPQAVDTAVGTPEKQTRVGLSLQNILSTVGELRVVLGILGVGLLLFFWKKIDLGRSLILGWGLMLLVMSLRPNWLLIDLPSSRIGNYLVYPFSILAAFFLWTVFFENRAEKEKRIKSWIFSGSFLLVFSALLLSGIYDSLVSFKDQKKEAQLFELQSASKYLASVSGEEDMILKDHNYITGDTWVKLFLMRGYRYPLSRSYFSRYEDEFNPREMCTLYMITEPGSKRSEECFSETGTNFVMVNPLYDESQFRRLSNFDEVFSSSGVAVFYRK